ncbi:sulfatase [Zhouia amylolytica]|nr:sulfatase [Zhouia amylolytica]
MTKMKIKFISQAIVGVLFVFLVGCKENKGGQNDYNNKAKPNFLFILVDDLGYSDLSCMGSQFYETPNIDSIYNQSMIFENGYTTCAVCSPSRASLLTGQFPARHGITDYIGAPSGKSWRKMNRFSKLLPPAYKNHLPFDNKVLPEALKEAGYRTFFAGKWHLGSKEEKSLPTDHGFDVNAGGYAPGGPYSGGYFSPFNNPYLTDEPEEKGMSLSMKLAKETGKFIEQNKDTTFLAYLSFYAVHGPIQTTKLKWEKYRNKAEAMGIDSVGFKMERVLPYRLKQDNPVYAGLVEQMDEAVGYVHGILQKNGLDKNTVIVFVSDNGGVVSGDNYSTNLLPLRGGKGYQWEGGTKVPFFIHVPWMENNGVKTTTPVTGADLYPTLLALAGQELKPQEHKDGVSLLPLLEGNTIAERPLYWHYPHYGNQGGEPHSIIRDGNMKLIHYWEDGHNELYDLKTDTSEQANLSESQVELTNELENKLMDWLKSVNAKFPEKDPMHNPDSAQIRLDNYKNKLLPRLEKQRKKMLQKDFEPNKDWWGSQTVD